MMICFFSDVGPKKPSGGAFRKVKKCREEISKSLGSSMGNWLTKSELRNKVQERKDCENIIEK